MFKLIIESIPNDFNILFKGYIIEVPYEAI